MSPTTMPTARRERGLRGSHVLIVFLLFFATVFAVNGAMIYWAVRTHTGLVANEPYRKGLHYNDRIAASERQAQLDWHDAITLLRDGSVSVRLATSDGRPVPSLALRAVIGRPATNRDDHAIDLKETEPGLYAGSIGPIEAGGWLLSLEARPSGSADEPLYRSRRRLWLTP